MGFLWIFLIINFVGALAISGIRLFFMIDEYRIRKRQEKQQKEKQ
jgi:hypothetical protein